MSTGLQEALDCMLVVLKCVNDSMHQIAITGVPVSCSNVSMLLYISQININISQKFSFNLMFDGR